jgi:hypothetical protein
VWYVGQDGGDSDDRDLQVSGAGRNLVREAVFSRGGAAARRLEPLDFGPYRDFAHRVDAYIRRDIVVALKP